MDDAAAVPVGAENNLVILRRIGKRPLCHHREGHLDRARRGGLSNLSGPVQSVLGGHRLLDIGGCDAQRGHPLRIHPDADRLIGNAHDLRLSGAGDALDGVQHIDIGIVGDVITAVSLFRREDADQHHDGRCFFLDGNPLLHHGIGELRRGKVDPVLDLHLGNVRIDAEIEINGDHQISGRGACRRHIQHAVDAVNLGFDRRGNRVRQSLGIRSRIDGLDGNLDRRDGRILLHGKNRHGNQTRQTDDNRDDGGKNWSLNEKSGEHTVCVLVYANIRIYRC